MRAHRGPQWGAVQEFGVLLHMHEHPPAPDLYDLYIDEERLEPRDTPLGEFIENGAAAYAERAQLVWTEMHDATISVARAVGSALVKAHVPPTTDLSLPRYDALPAKLRPKLMSGWPLDISGEGFVVRPLGINGEAHTGQTMLLLGHSQLAKRTGALVTVGAFASGVHAEGVVPHNYDDQDDCELLCVDTLARRSPQHERSRWSHRSRDRAAHAEQADAARTWRALGELMESHKLTSETILRQIPQ